ncbi:type VI secretion system baseplate subunit TssE [Glaciimonas sp. Gout2]|uniref:type VI secretion system baseplate subunit TssE n=1 Tax=unclassified Glaciimonas TaxID=2644401 RepID=UPI002B2255DD|nr:MULTISPECIES: type VI secretion system baseplate subunit TssE [unclassified Glaciimonas]MEB0014297.1 type VI secretion system baseplate subunit TssE [Glaciimonas sp. Cout2]MEB0084944.1 type VI secretion system baseplate subunit TssE [Glaciimonas sp. Gout2]
MSQADKLHASTYLPTLIDRLQDDAPNIHTEPPHKYLFGTQAMRSVIKRDLTLLLNTTNLSNAIDEKTLSAVASSVMNYGIPALSGEYIADRNWIKVERMIRKAIVDFEPRLLPDSLSLRPLTDNANSNHYNILFFELNALIHWSPYPLEFRIQSAFDLETAKVNFLKI